MRKYCLNCGKKFYPKSYYSYPQTEYTWGHDPDLHARHEVPAEHRHFHSLNCMKVSVFSWDLEVCSLVSAVITLRVRVVRSWIKLLTTV